jgi:hypothetical protein
MFRLYAEPGSVRLLQEKLSPMIHRQFWDAVRAELAGNAAQRNPI